MRPSRDATRRVVVYGKGGIGKSTVVSNLAVLFQASGLRVLQIGCDPKADSSHLHLAAEAIRPVLPGLLQNFDPTESQQDRVLSHIVTGRTGVDCLEAGGPEAGRGCAGLGISTVLKIFDRIPGFYDGYDLLLYDVLGDVVCGGFGVPLRGGRVSEVYIVTSGDVAALFAANNIARAVTNNQSSGARLGGLIVNRLAADGAVGTELLEDFAGRLSTRVVGTVPADALHSRAAREGGTAVERYPDSAAGAAFRELFAAVRDTTSDDLVVPTPMGDVDLLRFLRDIEF